VDKGAAYSIWQVKQRWARRFNPDRVKTFDFQKIIPTKNIAKFFLQEIFMKNKNFTPMDIELSGSLLYHCILRFSPMLLNLPESKIAIK
jgi:hypothetical protein